MKPLLATDFDEDKLVFPFFLQPKIDGVRGLNMEGKLTGRSLKTHKNRFTTAFYSQTELIGLDGELAANSEVHPDLCRLTSSALGTIEGQPYTLWWLFDYVTFSTRHLPYDQRYELLLDRVREIYHINNKVWQHLRVVPNVLCSDMQELLRYETKWLEEGYEGVIIRKIDAPHKEGRSTVKQGQLLRIKRFIEEEAYVLEIIEGEENTNEAQINELGNTFRSSHQENKVPNGMVGSMTCRVLKDVFDPVTKVPLLSKDQIITVSPGNMDHNNRRHYFTNQKEILGRVIKFKFFPKGLKDKPRFPTFITIRDESDL